MMRSFFATFFLFCLPVSAFTKDYQIKSPDSNIRMNISVDKHIELSIYNNDRVVVDTTTIGLIIDGDTLGINPKVAKVNRGTVENVICPIIKIKSDKVRENYNELTINFKGKYSVVFRAYNEGVAYRFKTDLKKEEVIVNDEIFTLGLSSESDGYLMKEKSFLSMSESPYIMNKVYEYEDGSLYSLPALFQTKQHDFVLFTESDVYDYPGCWLQKSQGSFHAVLPQKAIATETESCISQQIVTKRADFLAKTKGVRSYPWRVFAIADQECKLITNQLVYLLAKPEQKGDYSWIKPGMATLDWWGRRNIYGADFEGGVNTETHKYFVDFNNKYGLKYFVLDDGWSDACDLRTINKNLDLDELSAYAKQNNVGLFFWVHAFALKQDIEGYLDFFKSKGAVGIKVDFFNRDDQDAINLFHQIAHAALNRRMIVDFHGACKPFGLSRTYPNVLTSEGLIEFEMNGVTDWANPKHHTLLPFIRMVAGPMDYLPGTLNNAQKKEFYQYGNRPVGLGSRSHSMALNVMFESPLTMLPDSPSDYYANDECTSFLTKIPVVWDETKIIDAKIGEYVILARRSGDDWYLAAITNWDARKLTVDLNFLGSGKYNMNYFMDGKNTNNRAIDFVHKSQKVDSSTTIEMNLSSGGGWVAKIMRKQ